MRRGFLLRVEISPVAPPSLSPPVMSHQRLSGGRGGTSRSPRASPPLPGLHQHHCQEGFLGQHDL